MWYIFLVVAGVVVVTAGFILLRWRLNKLQKQSLTCHVPDEILATGLISPVAAICLEYLTSKHIVDVDAVVPTWCNRSPFKLIPTGNNTCLALTATGEFKAEDFWSWWSYRHNLFHYTSSYGIWDTASDFEITETRIVSYSDKHLDIQFKYEDVVLYDVWHTTSPWLFSFFEGIMLVFCDPGKEVAVVIAQKNRPVWSQLILEEELRGSLLVVPICTEDALLLFYFDSYDTTRITGRVLHRKGTELDRTSSDLVDYLTDFLHSPTPVTVRDVAPTNTGDVHVSIVNSEATFHVTLATCSEWRFLKKVFS